MADTISDGSIDKIFELSAEKFGFSGSHMYIYLGSQRFWWIFSKNSLVPLAYLEFVYDSL